ncbi:BgTH12-07635 [Blumeria graminis f. sp. triticale]|uniref:Mediator of RNA polymerase II transcription subunit 18 n=1 Tax=Blumeria graminis f. sp. triticale TaxID=1689686 RepID=A0A9W4CXM8_BLUGR|nr:BgTH12-07635 [Blumeria graminis f. sp. triticale]
MHEVFLESIILQEDLEKTVQVLQGYCNMAPANLLRRKTYWQGPKIRNPKGLNLEHDIVKLAAPAKKLLWKSLHEYLSKQSYVLTVTYNIDSETHAGKDSEGDECPINLDELPGTLRWTDVPEPGVNKLVYSRLFITIEDETNLCEVLNSSNYRMACEIVEEVQRFVHDHVMFELYRISLLPLGNEHSRIKIPPFHDLTLFDSEDKWILRANVVVLDGMDQAQMTEGVKLMAKIKSDFEGFIDFGLRDRLIHDTRIKF